MTEVGCYTLDLYCNYKNETHEWKEFPHVYTGPTREFCRRDARRDGWVFGRGGLIKCPKCVSMQVVVLDPHAV